MFTSLLLNGLPSLWLLYPCMKVCKGLSGALERACTLERFYRVKLLRVQAVPRHTVLILIVCGRILGRSLHGLRMVLRAALNR